MHATDGSAAAAHCGCIQEKHLLGVEGLAGEGVTLAEKEDERAFYRDVASWATRTKQYILANVHGWNENQEKDFYMGLAVTARTLRANIQNESFDFKEKCGCVGCPACAASIEV